MKPTGASLLALPFVLLGVATCPAGPAASAPDPAQTPPDTGGAFVDVTAAAGLDFTPQFCHDRIANIILSNGSGGAVLDFDNDGWMDIYLVNSGPLPGVTSPRHNAPRAPNRLFRNRGNGTFEDVTQRAGVAGNGFGTAATAGDFDNDGFTDLYLVNIGRSLLLRNRGDGTFEDVTNRAGVGHVGTGIGAVWIDADRDGWLDLFLANYLTFDPSTVSEQNPGAYPGPLAYPGEPNVFYRNQGDGTFVDATVAAGLQVTGHRAMAVAAFDADRDGDTDLYVANDDTPNALWINDGKGRFEDVAIRAGAAFNSIGEAPGSMNGAPGDFNGDNLADLFVTRLGYGSLYLRNAKGLYDDRMYASGLGRITRPYVGWGGVALDFDNDADTDLFVTNGDAFTLPGTRSLLLENDGQARFTDAAATGGDFFSSAVNGRGAAVIDFDNDGRQDLLLTQLAGRTILLHNRTPAGRHWIAFRLTPRTGNRSGYGALLSLTAGGRTRTAEALCPTGFLLQGDPRVHFGLGAATAVERVAIRWPDGSRSELQNPAVDRIHELRQP